MKFRVLLFLFLIFIITGCRADYINKCEEISPAEISSAEPVTEIVNNGVHENNILEIYVFGIGRADAIIITTENHAVMIDTGENSNGHEILDYLLSRRIRTIDYLIITHFDRDHVGGAHTVIDFLEVKEIIVPNYKRESRHVERFELAMQRAGIEPLVLTETIRFELDNAGFMINPAQSEYFFFAYDDEDEDSEQEAEPGVPDYYIEEAPAGNNFSIVVSVSHGENNFLFTGDAQSQRMREMLENEEIANTDYDFLKVPRHGRYMSRSAGFINAVSPKYAVITDSRERPADERVISALENAGAEIFLTRNGGVYVKSDGGALIVEHKD